MNLPEKTTPSSIEYSIVIPVYCNEGCLFPLMAELCSAMQAAPYKGEIIFVDDGSADKSFAELQQLRAEHPGVVTLVKLTRNFGQANALLAGYRYAVGRCVITMSADGQESPELIRQMLEAFFQEHYEIAICFRTDRDESVYRKLTSRIFYLMMRHTTFKQIPKGGFDFFLMGRRALEAILRNSDPHTFLQERLLWTGYAAKFIPYRRRKRFAGTSRYTFFRKCGAVLDLMLGHSFAPIRMMSLAGCCFSLIGFAYAAMIFIDAMFFGNPVKGWAPLMIIVLVMGGFQMIMLGVIGEYLWRTLTQVRKHDYYLIEGVMLREEVDKDRRLMQS
jgi:dolichol-phosphate mannosyltransferase